MKIDKVLCDNCGKADWDDNCPVRLSCGFGSVFDDMNLDFCSDECCMEFIKCKLEECKENGGYTLPIREGFEKDMRELWSKKSIGSNKCLKEKEKTDHEIY